MPRREEDATAHLKSEAEAAPWIPAADAHADGPGGHSAPAPQRPSPADPLIPQTFRRHQRLTTPQAYRRVYLEGRSLRRHGLDLRVAPPPAGSSPRAPRLGLSVRRAVVRASVRRNQWKRWVREVFRRHREAVPPGYDVVVSVVQDDPKMTYQTVETTLIAMLGQAQLKTPRP